MAYLGFLPGPALRIGTGPAYNEPVIVVVQQTKTRLFLGKAGGWVSDAVEARDFRRAADAVAYCTVECLVDVRVVIISDDPSQVVCFCPESSRQETLRARKLRRKNRELQKKQMPKTEVQAGGANTP